MLSYAITIHKSQVSEYPIVIMPITMSHFVMLQRNLIYTGITRAKKLLVLIGDKKALYYELKLFEEKIIQQLSYLDRDDMEEVLKFIKNIKDNKVSVKSN